MFSVVKAEEDTLQVFLSKAIDELQPYVLAYQKQSEEVVSNTLLNLIRETFGKILLLDYAYTFEEIVEELKKFSKRKKNFEEQLSVAQQQYSELLKQNKKTPEQKTQLRDLRKEITQLKKKVDDVNWVSTQLNSGQVKKHITQLCIECSYLKYSKRKTHSQRVTHIIHQFIWILNHLVNKEPKSFFHFHHHKHEKVEHLLAHAHDAHKKKDHAKAKQMYHELLDWYHQASPHEREHHHSSIFNLWFLLYKHS